MKAPKAGIKHCIIQEQGETLDVPYCDFFFPAKCIHSFAICIQASTQDST
jgi:hypothetical protein